MTADDIFGPETEEEMERGREHPVMKAMTAPRPKGLLDQLFAALGEELRGS
jgi:hypothetical protein